MAGQDTIWFLPFPEESEFSDSDERLRFFFHIGGKEIP